MCSEAVFRNSLNDDDFWDYVFNRSATRATSDLDEPFDDDQDDEHIAPDTPCPICGSLRECGTDSEGRPMIHCLPAHTDD